jgi:hypothetical protein
MSDYSYDRAILLGLVGQLSSIEKEEFKREVQEQLVFAMDQEEFREFIEHSKEALLRKKRRFNQEELQTATVYA